MQIAKKVGIGCLIFSAAMFLLSTKYYSRRALSLPFVNRYNFYCRHISYKLCTLKNESFQTERPYGKKCASRFLVGLKLELKLNRNMGTSTSQKLSVTRVCWNCNQKEDSSLFFCSHCRKVLKPPEVLSVESPESETSPISLFQMLEVEPSFEVNLEEAKKNYRKFQAMLHPDRFSNCPEIEQQYSQEISSMLNEALTTIESPYLRAEYLLRLVFDENVTEDSTSLNPGANLPTEFLQSILEWNEVLEDSNGRDLDDLKVKLSKSRHSVLKQLSEAFEKQDVNSIKGNIAKLKYFDNISAKLKFIID